MRALAVAMGVAALLAVACGDDDGGEAVEPPTTAAPDEGESAPPYPDHQSEQYAGTSNWICHPELADDECRDLSTTVVAPDGSRTVAEAAADPDAPFDCFYVFPTTSSDPGPLADLDVDESEIDTVRAQAARYASVCRVFAPAYRQITLQGLGGGATAEDRATAYGDVVDAWRSYVADQNDGRGVVVIGHSQGAGHLSRLIADEIGPRDEVRALLVSAVLLGSSVPADGFEGVPPCTSADESGCVVSYSSYPAGEPPVEGAIFGRTREAGQPALCVDPVELLGAGGQAVEAVLPTRLSLLGGIEGFDDVATPFVSLPEAVRLSCVESGDYGYLAVELAAAPGDTRPLDGLVEQRLGPTWGLHLLDANLGQDQLIELVSRQAAAHAEVAGSAGRGR